MHEGKDARETLTERLEAYLAAIAAGPEKAIPRNSLDGKPIQFSDKDFPLAAAARRAAAVVKKALWSGGELTVSYSLAGSIAGFAYKGKAGTVGSLPAPPAMMKQGRALLAAVRAESSGRKPRKRSVAITTEDELILSTLADAYPAAVNQPELSSLTGKPRQKISERLKWLESKRYVKRPEGTKRKGRAITAAGLSAIGRPVEGPH